MLLSTPITIATRKIHVVALPAAGHCIQGGRPPIERMLHRKLNRESDCWPPSSGKTETHQVWSQASQPMLSALTHSCENAVRQGPCTRCQLAVTLTFAMYSRVAPWLSRHEVCGQQNVTVQVGSSKPRGWTTLCNMPPPSARWVPCRLASTQPASTKMRLSSQSSSENAAIATDITATIAATATTVDIATIAGDRGWRRPCCKHLCCLLKVVAVAFAARRRRDTVPKATDVSPPLDSSSTAVGAQRRKSNAHAMRGSRGRKFNPEESAPAAAVATGARATFSKTNRLRKQSLHAGLLSFIVVPSPT